MGVAYFTDADDFCEEHPEVVILATSILSTESVRRGGAAGEGVKVVGGSCCSYLQRAGPSTLSTTTLRLQPQWLVAVGVS